MAIASLKKILSPPSHPKETSRGASWPLIDNEVFFPADYIEFINLYGSGKIADFITIFNVFSKNENINFFEQKKIIISSLYSLVEEDSNYYAYTLYPAANGLLPIGVTDNGDYIFWVATSVTNSNLWNVAVIASRSPDIEYIEGGIVGFLEGVLSKKIHCSSFPPQFPSNEIKFTSI